MNWIVRLSVRWTTIWVARRRPPDRGRVGAVGAAAEQAEGGGHAPRLRVDGAPRPRRRAEMERGDRQCRG
ncbi:MAG TPA: hypothetical protein PKW63_18840 [Vicinamibacterales bacterium]|nr:hypothetical protein [Vicinamibacterales bacterium]